MSAGPQNVRGIEHLQRAAAKALDDDAYRERLISDPKTVLREEGLQIGDEVELVIHENTPNRVHLVLPSRPMAYEELDVEEVDLLILTTTTHF